MKGERSVAKIRVAGRVQNVGFRAWTKDKADALGLSGCVANEPDGTVSVLLVGTSASIERMVDALWEGPSAAAVTGVAVETLPPDSNDLPNGFIVKA